MAKLGVNIDHIATLRQARRQFDPDPVTAVRICEKAGAHIIVAHLREDRRHINDRDIKNIKQAVRTRFNMELSATPEIVDIAAKIRPHQATLVPERRQEITTEGGLDVVRHYARIKHAARKLQDKGIEVSLFIAPAKEQIDRTKQMGVGMIELHTGCYDLARTKSAIEREFRKIKDMTRYARSLGLTVNAGHGLKYHNTRRIAQITGMEELNIGHSIISRAVFVGLEGAVKEMLRLVR